MSHYCIALREELVSDNRLYNRMEMSMTNLNLHHIQQLLVFQSGPNSPSSRDVYYSFTHK